MKASDNRSRAMSTGTATGTGTGTGAAWLQRKCDCGNKASALGGECEACARHRSLGLQRKLAIGAVDDPLEREADRAAEQVTRGNGAALATGAPRLSRRAVADAAGADGSATSATNATNATNSTNATAGAASDSAPPSVHDTLRAPGEALPPALREELGARFAHDFGSVRVHKDAGAARSARAVDAQAYTVGTHVVFGAGHYAPHSTEGRQLLAHELAHVVQQSGSSAGALQRQSPKPAPVDAQAQRIIDLAQDGTRPIAERAVAVVQAIIDQYYATDASKVTRIRYVAGESGLHITYAGRGAASTGQIDVGRYFVENTTTRHFARRVAQVHHEIEHIEQQRAGMAGEGRQDEREFAAFHHEALFQEPAGTGRIQHSTRVTLIDAALGYYHCLSAELQRDNQTRRDELVTRRAEAVRRSGHSDAGEAPSACRRQSD